jgi:hypothetical protein
MLREQGMFLLETSVIFSIAFVFVRLYAFDQDCAGSNLQRMHVHGLALFPLRLCFSSVAQYFGIENE